MAPVPQARVKHDGAGTHVGVSGSYIGWGGATPVSVPQAITGSLSTVSDAPAKAVLTSIIAQLVELGLCSDGTS